MDGLELVLAGAAAVCVCDVIRALKNGADAKAAMGGLLDLFSISAGAGVLWAALMCVSSGEVRLYRIAAAAIGAVLYILTIKTLVYKAFYIVFKNIFKIFKLILKILLTPAHFLYKMLCVGFYAVSAVINGKKGDDADAEKT